MLFQFAIQKNSASYTWKEQTRRKQRYEQKHIERRIMAQKLLCLKMELCKENQQYNTRLENHGKKNMEQTANLSVDHLWQTRS